MTERLTTFPGMADPDNRQPSDVQIAVGTNYVVEMVNWSGQVYDKTGKTVGNRFDLGTFFGFAANSGTDPRVIYDESSGRFFASYEGLPAGGDEVDVAVSETSDPTGNWDVYAVGSNTTNLLMDQPKLGLTNDKVTLSWNDYQGSGAAGNFKGVETAVVNKAELVACCTITISTFAQDSGKFQVVPAHSLGAINDQYAMWHSGTDVKVITITGVPGVSTVSQSENTIGIGTADAPPAAAQPGGTVTTNDGRMLSVTWQNNHLWGVFNAKCTPPNDTTTRACQRYIQVSTSGSQSLATNDNLGMNGGDLYFGSVALNSEDDLFSGFTASSSSLYPSAAVFGLPGGNFPPTVFGDIFYSGDATYTGNRWGDYSGTGRDPSNPKDVWTGQQAGGFKASSGDWGTGIGRYTLAAPTITSVNPNHAPELSAACAPTVTVGGTEFVNGGTSVSFGAVAGTNVSVPTPNQLTVKAPAQARGTVDITATTANGTSATSAADQFTYDPDTTAPVSSASPSPAPLAGNDGWTNGPVQVTITAADETCGSGVKNMSYSASGAQTIGLTTVAGSTASFSISSEGVTTVSFYATDNANNVESTKSLVVKVDNTAPRVAFTTPPAGEPYLLNQPVAASYACVDRVDGTDGGVGVASCSGPVPNGSNITTGTIGTFTFTVNTADKLANATAQSTTYRVTYKICLQYDPTKASGGRAYQIMVQICDYNNANVSTSSIKLTATAVDGNPAELKALGNLNSGNVFLYGPSSAPGASYFYNLDTQGLSSGTHVLNFTVQGDPVPHTATFTLK